MLNLHGRIELRDPVTREPPTPSAAVRDPTRGLPEVEVDGVVFRRGGRVVLRPGLEADLQARMLDGRTVDVERIYLDYDGKRAPRRDASTSPARSSCARPAASCSSSPRKWRWSR